MIENPERYIDAFARAGADWITVHQETGYHLHRTIGAIKELGCKAGAVLNPATGAETIAPILGDLDLVMLMSVNPGFGGQSFIRSSLDKTRRLRELIREKNPSCAIEIDGGVSPVTIGEIAGAGANIFVAGSAVFGADDYEKVIREMRETAEKAFFV